jgi:tetratricopeptide (TPR) repeat protein
MFIGFNPNEPSYYTNRALSNIQMKEFTRAIEDSEAAVRVNPQFARAYQRLYKCRLSLGDLQAAKEALERAKELDPADQSIQKDAKTLENV